MLESVKKEWKKLLIILAVYSVWWIAVLFSLISLQGIDATIKQFGSVLHLYSEVIHSIVKGTLVYYILIFKLAIPLIRTGKRKKILMQYLLLILFITFYEYIWDFKTGDPSSAAKANISLGAFFVYALGLDLIMAVISIFIATWIESNDALKREEELEKQKLNAELSAIKYQINPHFLFNSLSFIYTKTVRTNPEAAHAVHLLSEIMSYALEEWEDLGRVPLPLEISHMKKVIEMNQIRFNNKLNIDYKENIEQGGILVLNNTYVPTLVFITLVENAFKHGDLNDEKNKVTVKLQVAGDNIRFSVSNKKKKSPKEPSNGIGLTNVQKRLQLMYGSKHSFIIQEDQDHYLTEININLNKL
ncbi:sensor histidine kinase [Pedobacter antarcticus]|uniref:sensor histidine kinase n=1 Tax=Pedobacter antarcticus TaxID=34086 RepID=UPI001C5683F7|nr:histidine kinase [Pedobacter antarcticus]